MTTAFNAGNGKITVPDILSRKFRPSSNPSPRKIVSLAAYDYPTACLLDEADVDIVLVGDSLGMVVLGYENTLPVTVDETVHHTRAVRRGLRRALLVADMPYGSYQVDDADAVRNALRLVKEGGAEAVKLEGGERRLDRIARLVDAEIPSDGPHRPDAPIRERVRRIPSAGQNARCGGTDFARRAGGRGGGSHFDRARVHSP